MISVMKSVLLVLALGGVALADAPSSRIAITVSRRGFEPGEITVAAKKPVTLVFTRTTEATCAKSIVVVVDERRPSRSRCRSTRRSRFP